MPGMRPRSTICLEKEIVPLFYDVDEQGISHGWVKVMKETMKMTGPNFCARRMAKEYTEKFYSKAIGDGHEGRDQGRPRRAARSTCLEGY